MKGIGISWILHWDTDGAFRGTNRIMNSSIFANFEIPRADASTKNMPLLASPGPITLLVLGYLIFVLKLGQILMKNRKPFDVKNLMLVYNMIQMIYNGIMFSLGFYYIILNPAYDVRCMETLPDDSPNKFTERYITYAYFLNKVLDLMDTVFFVLRKSYKQITFLHVYHHIMMVYGMFWVVRMYGVGGQYAMMGFINAFVHTVMYFYYFISALNPGLKQSIWWKKYITCIQLIQFVILFLQAVYVLIFNPGCKFPLILQYHQVLQAVVMILMFGKFYYYSYIKPQRPKQQ